MSAAFPLILTFSLGEKEQQLRIFAFAKTSQAAYRSSFIRTLRASYHLWVHGPGERNAKE
jgi:hypothetical protein